MGDSLVAGWVFESGMTVSVRAGSRRAGAPEVAAPAPEAPPAKAPASTEQVSISLIDLLEELKNHVGTDKQEGLQQLKQRAAEHPEEQVKLKRDILNLTGAEALRAAVTALMNKPKPPPPELLIPSLWAEGMSKEDFKASLVHSFHCRTPSCPVPDCASITSKLQRLHQHVSTCETDNCLLCRMWTHLKYYRDAADQGGGPGGLVGANASSAALFTEPLINSSQLLPRWQQGAPPPLLLPPPPLLLPPPSFSPRPRPTGRRPPPPVPAPPPPVPAPPPSQAPSRG